MTINYKYLTFISLTLIVPTLLYLWGWGSIPLLFRAVPDSCIAIVQTNNIERAYQKLQKSAYYSNWQQYDAVSKLQNGFDFVDSLFLADNHRPQKLLASLHLINAYNYDYLLVMPTEQLKKPLPQIVSQLRKKGFVASSRVFRGTTIYDICSGDKKLCFAITTCNGLALASFSSSLVDEAVSQYNSWQWWGNVGKKVMVHNTSADATLFLNLDNAPLLSSVFLKTTYYSLLETLKELSNWAQLDMWFNEQEVQLKGTTNLNNSGLMLANVVKQSPESAFAAIPYLPLNTAFLLYYNAKGGTHTVGRQSSGFSKQFGKSALWWMGNEWAYGFTEPGSENTKRESYMVLQITDTTAAAKLLQSLTPENATKQANTKYQKYTLHYADTHLLAEHLFGESLSKHFTASYYTIINNFVLIGGSAEHLQVLIEKHLAKQTLTKADLQTGNSLGNAILYINQKLMNEWLRGVSGAKFNEDLGSRLAAAQNLHPLVVQFDKDPNGVATQCNLQYGKDHTDKSTQSKLTLLWNTQLDAPPATTPQLVKNAQTGDKEIVVVDKNNTLYLISNTGEVLWKRKFDKPILSKIYQIDYYGDKSLFYLLNTADNIYLIDHNGEELKEFTKRLSIPATAGLSCLKLANEDNYYFFVPCGVKGLYGYEYSGKPLPGWTPRQWLGNLTQPLKYIQYRDKDAIVAINDQGNLYLLDRRGKALHTLELKSPAISPPQIDLRKGEPKILLTTADSKTHLVNINGEGWGSGLVSLSKTADFTTANVISDLDEESIFLSHNKVFVYGFDSKLYEYRFADKIIPTDVFGVKLVNKAREKIGVFCRSNQQVYLLDEYAKFNPNFPLAASTPFMVTNLVSENEDVLLMGGTSNNVLAYKLVSN